MLSTKFKSLKKMATFGAIAAACGFAKADTNMGEIQDATQFGNGTVLLQKDDAAQIGIKTPWMFVRPDGSAAFANDFTTNATEVVSDETGTNVYANVNGKITKFTLKDGIPSKTGEEYGLLNQDGTTNTTAKLITARGDKLVGYDDKHIDFFKKDGKDFKFTSSTITRNDPIIDTYTEENKLYTVGPKYKHVIDIDTEKRLDRIEHNYNDPLKIIGLNETTYVGRANGCINDQLTGLNTISGLSVSKDGTIFASSTNDNKYVEFNPNQVNPITQHTAPTSEGVKKVIDNRGKNGTLLFVTKGGIERQ